MRSTDARAARVARYFLWALGSGLLAQGTLTLAFLAFTDRAAEVTHGMLNADPKHGAIHVVWGLIILLMLVRRPAERVVVLLALVFGAFYSALAVLGIVMHDPLDLQLGAGENGFHLLIGPPALLLGCWGWWQARRPGRPLGQLARPSKSA